MISFEVLGTPAPKGSVRAFYKAGMKRAVLVKDNSDRQKSWEQAVREGVANMMFATTDIAARLYSGPEISALFVDTALSVTIVFHVQRPKSAKKKPRPMAKPDIDKLARCTLDAMTGSVFDDDSRIADLVLSKRWAEAGREGATITITEADS